MEFRWDGPQMVKNLGDNPPKSAINALFAIPGNTKSDSSLPHHSVTPDGTVGAADQQGCEAAIEALNGARGGVGAGQAEKNKAYSHLASHLRSLGVTPPEKQFARSAGLELRHQRRASMLQVPERLNIGFGAAGIEMRAKPSGTGGTKFSFHGYAAVFDYPFEMWDYWGDLFTEVVNQGAFTRTLANNCDVPFLIGHNDMGISLARTRSGTMVLGQDSHGLWVDVPDLDGGREDVRALASAHDRGDMDEMSCAFVAIQAQWSPDYEQRNLTEMDLHKGDVSVVVFGANDGTAGSTMVALPAESLMSRRPTGIRQRRGEARASHEPMTGTHSHSHPAYGSQGGDQAHEHAHSHDGDASHDHRHMDADGDYDGDERSAGRRRERREADEIVDLGGPPDSNVANAVSNGTGSVKCPYTVANGCGAMNSGSNKFCGSCGGALYEGDGTLVVDDSGAVELEGGADELGLRQRELELLMLTG